jgi:putative membrane protein
MVYELSFDAQNFSMPGLSIHLIPNSFGEIAASLGFTDEGFSDDMEELVHGADELAGSAGFLAEGLGRMNVGAGALLGRIPQVVGGANAFGAGLLTMAGGVGEFAGGLDELADGLDSLAESGAHLRAMIEQQLEDPDLDFAALALLTALLGYIDSVEQAAGASYGLRDGANGLSRDFAALSSQYAALHSGVGQAMTGAQDLAGSIGALLPGAEFLRDGAAHLALGQRHLSEGLTALLGETGIDGEHTPPVSFAGAGEIMSVQFILRTADIALAPAFRPEPLPEPNRTLWQRFLDLFRRS